MASCSRAAAVCFPASTVICTDKLEIPVWVSETALTNVVTGCLKVLETPTALKQTLMRSK